MFDGPALDCSSSTSDVEPISLGPLAEHDHNVSGNSYLLSERVLDMFNFTYDGTLPRVIAGFLV
jgi:hypothetical protein